MSPVSRHLTTIAAALALAAPLALAPAPPPAEAAVPLRSAEDLGRGVVAVRTSDGVFVSWRLLGLDPENITFNVYRSTAGGAAVKLNDEPLSGGTNFTDTTADLTRRNSYYVRPVVDGVWWPASTAFMLTADHAVEPAVRIPIRDGGPIKFAWVGDLDGDGEYDYVIDRQTSPQTVEAYRSDGTFLWELDLGPNSVNQNNIEPGSSTIDVGHWDGLTVADLDEDGVAEIAIRVGGGVTFGDGETIDLGDDISQAIAVVDGLTGELRASAPLPDDYVSDGPLAARLAVGHLDGEHPSIVGFMKNRHGTDYFNLVYASWRFDGEDLEEQWQWHRGETSAYDGHNTRIIDVDGDGADEIAEIGFVLNGDGTLRYSLADQGIRHGDRFFIGDLDPDRPGLEGYGVQQNNPELIWEYAYDADTGELLWTYEGDEVHDVGRGSAADIDPTSPGAEVWSFSGVKSAATGDVIVEDTSLSPWPDLRIWWDGDLLAEQINDRRIEKWDHTDPRDSSSLSRLLSTWNYGAVRASGGRNPVLYGDILGDWREEVVYANSAQNELIVFTTDIPTDERIYTLPHNPAYRNALMSKGYLQSLVVDYFLGAGMATPPIPSIRYVEGG